jgi:hypothetical protein
LIEANSNLEENLKLAGTSKSLVDTYSVQIGELQKQKNEQEHEVCTTSPGLNHVLTEQIADLQVRLEVLQADLDSKAEAHERDMEELHLYQAKAKELDLAAETRVQSLAVAADELEMSGNTSLGEELDGVSGTGASETKASCVEPISMAGDTDFAGSNSKSANYSAS